jgi:hypothetical protein
MPFTTNELGEFSDGSYLTNNDKYILTFDKSWIICAP